MDYSIHKDIQADHNGGRVQRFHTFGLPAHLVQSVAEHSFGMICLLFRLEHKRLRSGDLEQLVWVIAHHDLAEQFTGDIPYPTKARDPAIKAALDKQEARHAAENTWRTESTLPPHLLEVLKALDMLELLLHVRRILYTHGIRDAEIFTMEQTAIGVLSRSKRGREYMEVVFQDAVGAKHMVAANTDENPPQDTALPYPGWARGWDTAPEESLRRYENADAAFLSIAEKKYGDSWKRRGGVGAFMNVARKMDRIALLLARHQSVQDAADAAPGEAGILDDIGDLRRYIQLCTREWNPDGGQWEPPSPREVVQSEVFRSSLPLHGVLLTRFAEVEEMGKEHNWDIFRVSSKQLTRIRELYILLAVAEECARHAPKNMKKMERKER